MTHKRTAFLILLGCMTACLLPVFADYGEPLDLPGCQTAADPMVLHADGVYYLYATTTYVSVECWTSDDLQVWSYGGVVWNQKPEGAWNDADVWAPEVHRDGDSFYLYYSANNKIGVARAQHPLGPFEDVYDHPIVGDGYGGIIFGGIDGHVFQDEDGARYFYYAGFEPLHTMRVVPMIDMVTLAETHTSLFSANILSWERFVVEAPWVLKRDGTYYMMYSGGGANLQVYATGYATASSPLGPFEKYSQNPILSRDWENDFHGPGHNSVVTGPDGALKIVYHTKVSPEVGWDRKIRISDLCWGEDGSLYVGMNGCDAQEEEDHEPSEDGDDDDDDDEACGVDNG